MYIRIASCGGAGSAPLVTRYEYPAPDDEVLAGSVRHIRGMLDEGRRININQVLLLVAARVAGLLEKGAGQDQIADSITGMVPEEMVMIGVPQLLRTMDLYAELGDRRFYLRFDVPVVKSG